MPPTSDAASSRVITIGDDQDRLDDALRDGYQRVLERIAQAARRVGREPQEVRLVAVSKGQPLAAVAALYRLGQRHFGENRVEEGSDKTHAARDRFAPETDPITWHMIGHVQSRKAKLAAADFDVVHSVDSVRLATRLDRFARELGRTLPVLLECNVSGESAKYGFDAEAFEAHDDRWPALAEAVEQVLALPNLIVQGLMTMAPVVPEPELTRPCFRRLRQLRERLRRHFPAAGWESLSMGMTDDFEVAVEEGATLVRVGRAIFGERA